MMKNVNATSGQYVKAPDTDNNKIIKSKDDLTLVDDNVTRNISYNAFKFSFNYFSPGIKKLFTTGGCPEGSSYQNDIKKSGIEKKVQLCSDIFKDIVTIPVCEKGEWWQRKGQLSVLKSGCHLDKIISSIIESHCKDTVDDTDSAKWLLYIQGPIGCYKNRLLQYIYLLESIQLTLPIFYIDFSKYESGTLDVKENLSTIQNIIKNYQGTPLFILDNVRGFVCGEQQDIYKKFSDYIDGIKCKIIVSRDVEFNRLRNRAFKLPFGCTGSYRKNEYHKGDYINEISISSLNMNRISEAESFIENCIEFFTQVDNSSFDRGALRKFCKDGVWNCRELRNFLTKLELFTLDAYQLKKILQYSSCCTRESDATLRDIYLMYCNELGLASSNIHESAFKFEYTDETINFTTVNDWWRIREHKSVLDYIISQYYCALLDAELKRSYSERTYNLPNVLFPKSVTRFIAPKYEKDSKIRQYIVECFDHYKWDIAGNFGRLAQLAFLLGRIHDASAVKALRECLKNVEHCSNKNAQAFLTRSLYVSLIYQGDTEALLLYCKKLINDDDDLNKNINIGFHLDYYGDQKYAFVINEVPNYTNETISKYLNTLRKLSLDLRKRIGHTNSESTCDNAKAILQLVTYCQIAEKRKFNLNSISVRENFIQDITDFLLEVLYVQKDTYSTFTNETIQNYFEKTLDQIIKKHFTQKDAENLKRVTLYNTFSRLYTIGRSGWLKRGLHGYDDRGKRNCDIAESVAEHTFNCWLIGYIFLPETITDNDAYPYKKEYYDKRKILELLLVHDCGEVKTGDIIKKVHSVQEKEKEAIGRLIGNDIELFQEWKNAWGDGTCSLNACIAYDIDHIQAVYQYFSYYLIEECKIEKCEKSMNEWLDELSEKKIKSEVGRQILKVLIFKNEKFIKNTYLFFKFYSFSKDHYRIND